MQNPILNIKDLHLQFKIYGGNLKVLNGINLKVWPKERVGLVGEAGCGKTTTVKSILRVLPITQTKITKGKIFYKGKDILKMKKRELQQIRREEISMIFQDPTASLNPVFSIGTQLQDVSRYSKDYGKNIEKGRIKADVIESLKKVSLPDPERMIKNISIQLSGGMRQRVCIAMALASSNNLLIADEPGTSLDVTIKDQILNLLAELVRDRGISIILISHALGSVRDMTDRTYVMYAGSMVEVAKTKELFINPLHPYTKGLLNAVPRLTGKGKMKGIPGYIPDYLNPPMGCRFCPRCEYAKPICKEKKPPYFKISESHEVACWLFRN